MIPAITVIGTRARRFGVVCLFLMGLLAGSGTAQAHKTNLTRGLVQIDGAVVTYSLSFSPHDVAVAAGMKTDFTTPLTSEDFAPHLAELTDYVSGRLFIESERGDCPLKLSANGEALPEVFLVTARARCAAPPNRLTIRFLIFFFDIDPNHRGIGRLILPMGGQEEFLFDAQTTEFTADIVHPAPPAPWHVRLTRLIGLGIEHILLGVDHILFVLLLVLAVPRAWPVARIVTAFTLAHSVTLGLAWYGVVDLPTMVVETAIALSVAYVAAENMLGIGRRWRSGIAALFGLVHGLGFYRVLSALELEGSSAALTLAGFNIGVEIGQLAVVGGAALPLIWARDKVWYPRLVQVLSGMVLLVALWWAVERAGFA
jgi:hypothetical protein